MINIYDVSKELKEFQNKTKIFKAISHPIRLYIVKDLIKNEGRNVSEINKILNIPQSTLSQHLGKLKDTRIIEGERNGLEVKYYVVNEDAKKIIKMFF